MNRPFGNLPIAWANSPSIVFNKRTSGWMPPNYSTLKGRNQIVQVDDNMNFVKELSNDFPTAQVAVWDTPRGVYGPANAIPGAPYPPGASSLSGPLGDIGDMLPSGPTGSAIIGALIGLGLAYLNPLAHRRPTRNDRLMLGGLGAVLGFLLRSRPESFLSPGAFLEWISSMSLAEKAVYFGGLASLGFAFSQDSFAVFRHFRPKRFGKRKNPVKPFGRWKNKKYAKRHGKKGKMSAAYMKRHNRRRSRK